MRNLHFLTLCLCAASLSSCSRVAPYDERYISYKPYAYENTKFANERDYERYMERHMEQKDYSRSPIDITSPESYYMHIYGSSTSRKSTLYRPVSHKEVDERWVRVQNPNSYTIEIANDAKASWVANKLYRMPKNNRSAQIRYYRNGKSYYSGLYGSYLNYEEAQRAFNNLPPDMKQGAVIKNWNNVQGNINISY
ncbi:SPOR domain-containing protein [Legionella fairfieldensis]|uniref:SPOR domain-containing protein n=1 Tax=Legionella fairfieldensis TaxID=45064 RepID=UPI00048B222E|nr:hypothetical protein [Legionella fairfieldensis]